MPPSEEKSPVTASRRGRRVLVVEDSVAGAKVLGLLLTKLGNHNVRTAHSGATALELARDFHPEVVLLDISLPDTSGYDVARQLRRGPDGAQTLLVALTGYGDDENRRMSREAGFDEHLLKPPSIEALRALLVHPRLV